MVPAIGELERGRESYATSAWLDAYESLSRADQLETLGAEDLELLARSAYMVGNDDDYLAGLERAHDMYLRAGETPRAARCAFWIGHNLLFRANTARATGWFARAQRLLERDAQDCVERGYLLIPVWLDQMAERGLRWWLPNGCAGGRDRRTFRRRGSRLACER